MCILIFPSDIWGEKCALYTAKYGNSGNKEESTLRLVGDVDAKTGCFHPKMWWLRISRDVFAVEVPPEE